MFIEIRHEGIKPRIQMSRYTSNIWSALDAQPPFNNEETGTQFIEVVSGRYYDPRVDAKGN